MKCPKCGQHNPEWRDYCMHCESKLESIAYHGSSAPYREPSRRSVKPIVGGVLNLISGLIITAIGVIVAWWGGSSWGILVCVWGAIILVGSVCAIARRDFWLAMLSAIAALLPFFFFGLPALILIALSSREFDFTNKVTQPNKVGSAYSEGSHPTWRQSAPASDAARSYQICSYCGATIPLLALYCPACGAETVGGRARRNSSLRRKGGDIAVSPQTQSTMRTIHEGKTTALTCPVCQTGFITGQSTITCSECSVRHHKECWEMIEGCSTFGCKKRARHN